MRRLLLAEFADPGTCASAVKSLRSSGRRDLDVYMPYPEKGIEEALELPKTPLARYVFIGGITGAVVAYLILWWTQHIDYPLDVGSHPTHSAPAFIGITFETAVLFASLTAFFGLLALCHLPRPYHPVFEVEGFERVSVDRFFLAAMLDRPEEEPEQRAALDALGALSVHAVDLGEEGT